MPRKTNLQRFIKTLNKLVEDSRYPMLKLAEELNEDRTTIQKMIKNKIIPIVDKFTLLIHPNKFGLKTWLIEIDAKGSDVSKTKAFLTITKSVRFLMHDKLNSKFYLLVVGDADPMSGVSKALTGLKTTLEEQLGITNYKIVPVELEKIDHLTPYEIMNDEDFKKALKTVE